MIFPLKRVLFSNCRLPPLKTNTSHPRKIDGWTMKSPWKTWSLFTDAANFGGCWIGSILTAVYFGGVVNISEFYTFLTKKNPWKKTHRSESSESLRVGTLGEKSQIHQAKHKRRKTHVTEHENLFAICQNRFSFCWNNRYELEYPSLPHSSIHPIRFLHTRKQHRWLDLSYFFSTDVDPSFFLQKQPNFGRIPTFFVWYNLHIYIYPPWN